MENTKNVLIIEDEILIAEDLAFLLEDMGYRHIGIANNSEKALELFCNHQVDLVLCDININGDKDGIETVQVLLQYKKNAHHLHFCFF